jgi:hypothetical protein
MSSAHPRGMGRREPAEVPAAAIPALSDAEISTSIPTT